MTHDLGGLKLYIVGRNILECPNSVLSSLQLNARDQDRNSAMSARRDAHRLTFHQMKTLLVIYNPAAGRGRVRAHLERVRRHLAK